MDFLLKLCVLNFILLNLFACHQAQDIFSAILGGIQNGINLVNNNMGLRDYPDYGPQANREVSFGRSIERTDNSEEPYNINPELHQNDNSNWNSEEYDRNNEKYIENKKRIPINNQKIYNNEQYGSPNIPLEEFNRNIQSKYQKIIHKPIIRKPELVNNQKPLVIQKETIDSSNIIIHNNNFISNRTAESLNSNNVITVNNKEENKEVSNTTSITTKFLVNNTVIDNTIPNLSLINDTSLNQNTLNSTKPVTTKTIEKDDRNVLKPLSKKKFFFQVKPVVPLDSEVSTNETIYYIDFD